jgi:hypothetical protein
MTDVPSLSHADRRATVRLFQTSLESSQKNRKFLNFWYTVSGTETYDARQQRLGLEVFQTAEIGEDDVLSDVEQGSSRSVQRWRGNPALASDLARHTRDGS